MNEDAAPRAVQPQLTVNNVPQATHISNRPAMVGRPRKACWQCSSQKLRCGGEKPCCDRCRKYGRQCQWGIKNASNPNPRRRDRTEGRIIGQQTPTAQPAMLERHVQGKFYTGIPANIVINLIDAYFNCVYSASLVFHKPSLLADIQADRVKPHVLLSTCALASSFYQSFNVQNDLRDKGFSNEWAEQAGRLAFLEAERPCEDTVVTFANLGLFWYSQGKWRRSLVYEGYAVLNARLLRLAEETGTEPPLRVEIRRRRFWATFLLNHFVSEPCFPKLTRKSVSNILLPVAEDEFETGAISNPHSMTLQTNADQPASILAEIIRIQCLWTDVYESIKSTYGEKPIESHLNDIGILDARLRQWRSQLPEEFQQSAFHESHFSGKTCSKVLLLHVAYYQSLCALHSSIVPLFLLCPVEWMNGYDHSQRISAQVAYENALNISRIVEAYLSVNPEDVYKWPGFVGFALYCSCIVQLPYLWCSDDTIKEKARKNITINISTMASISQNWRYVASLILNVKTRYQQHSIRRICPEGEPTTASIQELAGIKRTRVGTTSSTLDGGSYHSHLINIGLEQASNIAERLNEASTLENPLVTILHRNIESESNEESNEPDPLQQYISGTSTTDPCHTEESITSNLPSLMPINDGCSYDFNNEEEYTSLISAIPNSFSNNFLDKDMDQALFVWFNQ